MFERLFSRRRRQFRDIIISKPEQITVGFEMTTRRYYLSIVVPHRTAAREEYYRISRRMFHQFRGDWDLARAFAAKCRRRQMGYRLMVTLDRTSDGA